MNELVALQYPQFPGVIVYYRRLRRVLPVPVRKEQKQEEKEQDENEKLAPQPAPVPVLQQISRFIRQVLESAEDAEAAARKFVSEHPEVRNYILATAIGLVVGTIVEDVLSGGAGILDDVASFRIAYALWRVASI